MIIAKTAGVMFVLACAFAGVTVAMQWMDNDPPYEFQGTGHTLTPNPAPQYSQIIIEWKIRHADDIPLPSGEPHGLGRSCPASVQRYFEREDGSVIASTDATPAASTVHVGDTVLRRIFTLPPIALPPETYYHAKICFQCNALQTVFTNRNCIMSPRLLLGVLPDTVKSRPFTVQ